MADRETWSSQDSVGLLCSAYRANLYPLLRPDVGGAGGGRNTLWPVLGSIQYHGRDLRFRGLSFGLARLPYLLHQYYMDCWTATGSLRHARCLGA